MHGAVVLRRRGRFISMQLMSLNFSEIYLHATHF